MSIDYGADQPAHANDKKEINLALQGGGAHGAYTWGVLDRFLAEERLVIESISGTSAGAVNAVVLADGMNEGGREGARRQLRSFWERVGRESFSFAPRVPFDASFGHWSLNNSIPYIAFDLFLRLWSPYDFNPLDINPLRDLVDKTINFDRVRNCHAIKLYISATNVHTGRIRVFERHELTLDMVMASACLPFLFKAVEINGVPYWDGGYMGNPALWPLFYESRSPDIVIVQINPVVRRETPRSARDILNRVNEITFNSSLLQELRAINFVGRLLDLGRLDSQHYKKMLVHVIDPGASMRELDASSKFNASLDFLEHLFSLGHKTADTWLTQNFEALGHRSTVDVKGLIA